MTAQYPKLGQLLDTAKFTCTRLEIMPACNQWTKLHMEAVLYEQTVPIPDIKLDQSQNKTTCIGTAT